MSSSVSAGGSGGKAKLLDRVREAIRLKHYDVSTTMIYTHVLNKPGLGVRSPLD